MLHTTSSDLPQDKALGMKQDDKFFSRLLSKEINSVGNPSFRVSIPFMWESHPGTPKHSFSTTSSIPPLTPPPSYYSNSTRKTTKKHSRSSLLQALFTKIMSSNPKENDVVSSSPSSLSSLSSVSWSLSSGKYWRRSRFSTPCSSFDSRACDEGTAAVESSSPASTRGSGSIGKCRGCYCWG
ncbi:hypothetical protein HRI_000116400 [Hibiscus trionum]|uniref:Uncharacterized protein n=1 Tax=Hibiscus trionum TaxID=183268 RepID=A0A9W7GT88_HIBTR|nr:hypothetical protein HRI_000116400 [Hibiscus trionum]